MATFIKCIVFQNNRQLASCLLFCVLILLFIACQQQPITQEQSIKDSIAFYQKVQNGFDTILAYQRLVHNGDIILRTGNDFTSQSLRQLARTDKTYSHCGIAFVENDSVFVYHAVGGEFNPNQQLKREEFAYFCSAEINRGFGIARFSWSEKQVKTLQKNVQNAFAIGLPFDMDFDLSTNDKMYCSEFVAKNVAKAFNDSTMFSIAKIGVKEFYAPDNIFLHKKCTLIKRIKF
jgi:hypothetical protein